MATSALPHQTSILRIRETSPRSLARLAGVLYLITGVAYSYGDGSVTKLLVMDDAAATAHNILTHVSQYRLGFAVELISAVGYIAVTLLFYDMFKPVNKSISLLAAFFSLTGCTVQSVSTLFHLAPLVVLGGDHYLTAFKVDQLQALAVIFLQLRGVFVNIYMVFFGWYCILIGYLIFRSTFLPKILGVFMAIAGLSYQVFLSPPLATYLFPYLVKPAGMLGELSLIMWLLVMGVNNQRWKEQAAQ